MVWTTTLSSKGQLVLPKPIREELGVQAGDKIVFIVKQGRVELQAFRGDILSWYGAAKTAEPQDWAAVQAETGRWRAEEVAGESAGH